MCLRYVAISEPKISVWFGSVLGSTITFCTYIVILVGLWWLAVSGRKGIRGWICWLSWERGWGLDLGVARV